MYMHLSQCSLFLPYNILKYDDNIIIIVLCIVISSVATFLKHLCMEFSYHNSAKACRNYMDFVYRTRLLTIWLLEQGYVLTRLNSSLQKIWSLSWTRGWLRCIHLHQEKLILVQRVIVSFPLSSPWTWLFMSNSVGNNKTP